MCSQALILVEGYQCLWGTNILVNGFHAFLSIVVVVQSFSCVWLFATPGIAARQASLSFTHLLELAQTHVLWVCDVIQPSHPLMSPSPPAFNLCQHQGLFQWVHSSHPVAKVLELQHQSLQWRFRTEYILGPDMRAVKVQDGSRVVLVGQ